MFFVPFSIIQLFRSHFGGADESAQPHREHGYPLLYERGCCRQFSKDGLLLTILSTFACSSIVYGANMNTGFIVSLGMDKSQGGTIAMMLLDGVVPDVYKSTLEALLSPNVAYTKKRTVRAIETIQRFARRWCRVSDPAGHPLVSACATAAREVWSRLGHGWPENIVEQAMKVELQRMGFSVHTQVVGLVKYKDVPLGGGSCCKADMLVSDSHHDSIIVELKSAIPSASLINNATRQLTRYMTVFGQYNLVGGMLIIFQTTTAAAAKTVFVPPTHPTSHNGASGPRLNPGPGPGSDFRARKRQCL